MSISFGPFCVSSLCMYGLCVSNNYRSSFQYNCAGIIKHNGTKARSSNRTAETSVCTEKKTRLVENEVITSPSPDRALILLLCNAYLYFGHIHSRSPPHTHNHSVRVGAACIPKNRHALVVSLSHLHLPSHLIGKHSLHSVCGLAHSSAVCSVLLFVASFARTKCIAQRYAAEMKTRRRQTE